MKVKILINGSIQNIIGTKYFRTTNQYMFLLIIDGKKYLVVVPCGFITDFGSIPSIFFNFDKSKYVSYILHDFLYSTIGEIKSIYGIYEYNQFIADQVLIAGLEVEGMIDSGRVLVLVGLTIGGKYNFKKINKDISLLKQTL